MSHIALSPAQLEKIVEQVKRDATETVVTRLISKHGDDPWLSPAQAGGILNLSPATLAKIKDLHRYELTPGNIQYRLSEVIAYRESKRA